MSTWVRFAAPAAFIDYHDKVCAVNGIPHPGRNAATGEVDPDTQWTTAWVAPIDDHGTIKANVPDDDVVTYSLTEADAPVYYNEDGTPVDDPPVPVDFPYEKEPGTRFKEADIPDALPAPSEGD